MPEVFTHPATVLCIKVRRGDSATSKGMRSVTRKPNEAARLLTGRGVGPKICTAGSNRDNSPAIRSANLLIRG